MLARMYDPSLGRFLSVDPLAGKYPHLSPYVYANNNPLKYVDPDGRAFLSAWAIGQAAAYLGIGAAVTGLVAYTYGLRCGYLPARECDRYLMGSTDLP